MKNLWPRFNQHTYRLCFHSLLAQIVNHTIAIQLCRLDLSVHWDKRMCKCKLAFFLKEQPASMIQHQQFKMVPSSAVTSFNISLPGYVHYIPLQYCTTRLEMLDRGRQPGVASTWRWHFCVRFCGSRSVSNQGMAYTNVPGTHMAYDMIARELTLTEIIILLIVSLHSQGQVLRTNSDKWDGQ
jgi:hypothetical protein